MKRILFLFPVLLSLIPISLVSSKANPFSLPSPTSPTPQAPPPNLELEAARQAIAQAVAGQQEYILGLLVNQVQIQNLVLSEDNQWAVAWLVLYDPSSLEALPTEPGLVLGRREVDGWQIALPADPGWPDLLKSAPETLLSPEVKHTWLEMRLLEVESASLGPFGGYLLPWEAGKTVWLSQSVAHDKYIPSGSAHYAFDFYVPQTMFNLYASKAGIVWRAKWDVPNNNHDGVGNYLVLQDKTTTPTTYQLYLHLAQGSIPPALRTQGTPVVQGQFIGVADNTGQSSGHHLHYQVHTNPDSYWGTSVDITFADVSINGGRPRRHDNVYSDLPYCRPEDVCDQFSSFYISSNVVAGDIIPPTGGISKPELGSVADTSILKMEGWALDQGSGLQRARFIAYYSGSWHDIDNEFYASPFSLSWDMCAAGVPDGPLSLALDIWDRDGNAAFNLPGLVHLTKQFSCPQPPPACTPADNQVALFSDPDFSGACSLFGTGDYLTSTALGVIGDDNAEAIQVGAGVLATLYSDANHNGRGETFLKNDANLSDNWIGANRLTSLHIRARSNNSPVIPPSNLVFPPNGAAFPAGSSLSLSWRVPPGATEFQVELDGPFGSTTSPWLAGPVWSLDNMLFTPGTYTWAVRARYLDKTSSLSTSASFTIEAVVPLVPPVSAPFSDDMESGVNGWTASGLWNLANDPDRAHSASHSWYYGQDGNYKTGFPNTGDLTSPPIQLPGSNTTYQLSFWYRYKTESPGRQWDRRWLQISKDGGPFTNVMQLYDDPQDYWLNPVLDLSSYAGSTILLRFHFESLDGAFNLYEGWFIDDIVISIAPPPICNDTDNSPIQATLIRPGNTKNGVICPSGDVDYYKFNAQAGDHIVADIDTSPENAPSDLDLYLILLDQDGLSVLSEHDDEIPVDRKDPHLGYLIRRSGTYYLKVRLWSFPSGGGESHAYSLKLLKDREVPSASFTSPSTWIFTSASQINLAIDANDPGSGISRVEFLWHSGDWLRDAWTSLGTDINDQDGWSYTFDTGTLADQAGMAFFANVYDWAGRWAGAGTWEIGLDRSPPQTSLAALPASPATTALQVIWSGADSLSGLDHFDLQVKEDNGPWKDVQPDPVGEARYTWFIGSPGHKYDFRLRGVDRAGNKESFPSSAETSSTIPSAAELCSSPDGWEDDNTRSSAQPIAVDGPIQTHNFCNPRSPDFFNDQDWLKFTAKPGMPYRIEAYPLGGGAAARLQLYASDGTTLLAETNPTEYDQNSVLVWSSDRSTPVYLKVSPMDNRIAGNDSLYLVWVRTRLIYIPLVRN